jgi:hypothetical protein
MTLKAVAITGGGGGGGISGSGTAGYVAKFTGGTSIGNSLVRDDGTSVSIDSSPSVGYKLTVNGDTTIVGRIDALTGSINTVTSRASNDLVLQRDGVEAARIIAGGLVGFGNTNPATTVEAYATVTGEVRASGDAVSVVSSCTYNNSFAGFAPFVRLSRSRGTRAAPAAVNALDTIGVVQWQARGTTDRAVANISCTAPANAGGDQISGQLTFATAQTTDALPVVRLTIDPAGVASFAGPVRATGTAATAPAFTGSDTDTGMSFPAANQVRLSTAGNVAIAVDASQNVGVGTTSPVAPMHVLGASQTGASIANSNPGILRIAGAATNALFVGSISDGAFGMYLQTNNTSPYPLVLQPAGGSVGIKVLSPATNTLDVSTAGWGVKLPSTPGASGAGTENILDCYEEGTWTPVDRSGASLSFTAVAGTYTRVGRTVIAQCTLTYPSTANASDASFSLPIAMTTANTNFGGATIGSVGTLVKNNVTALIKTGATPATDSRIALITYNGAGTVTNANMSLVTIVVSVMYNVA